jgi:hypothetical protein
VFAHQWGKNMTRPLSQNMKRFAHVNITYIDIDIGIYKNIMYHRAISGRLRILDSGWFKFCQWTPRGIRSIEWSSKAQSCLRRVSTCGPNQCLVWVYVSFNYTSLWIIIHMSNYTYVYIYNYIYRYHTNFQPYSAEASEELLSLAKHRI